LEQVKKAEEQFIKVQDLIKNLCVPGGTPVVIESEGTKLAVQKVFLNEINRFKAFKRTL